MYTLETQILFEAEKIINRYYSNPFTICDKSIRESDGMVFYHFLIKNCKDNKCTYHQMLGVTAPSANKYILLTSNNKSTDELTELIKTENKNIVFLGNTKNVKKINTKGVLH